jgi:hypothetical protein
MPKMYFLVLRRIHVPAQIVAGTEQQAGELAQGKFSHEKYVSSLLPIVADSTRFRLGLPRVDRRRTGLGEQDWLANESQL